MSDEPTPESLSEEANAKIRDIVEGVVRRVLSRDVHIPSILTPLDPFIHEETLAQLMQIIHEPPSSSAQASIGASNVDIAGKAVLRISATGTLSVTGSAVPQLIDPDTSMRFWKSPLGLAILQIAAMLFVLAWQECSQNMRDAKAEKAMKEIVQQIENFWLVHKEQPLPSPTPTLNEMGD